jgi:hypothetical protein
MFGTHMPGKAMATVVMRVVDLKAAMVVGTDKDSEPVYKL